MQVKRDENQIVGLFPKSGGSRLPVPPFCHFSTLPFYFFFFFRLTITELISF